MVQTFLFCFRIVTENLIPSYTGKIPSQDVCTNRENIIPKIRQFAVLNESNSDKKFEKPQYKSSNNFKLDHQQACEAYDTLIELAKDNGMPTLESVLEKTSVLIDNKTENLSKTIYLDGKSLFYGKYKPKFTNINKAK